jgi:hypothetical protein
MHHKPATPTTPALRLTPDELRIHANIYGLDTDVERQAAFHVLDAQIRARLPIIPERRYYTFNPVDGAIIIDMKRDRPLPVLKISKSNQL